MSRTAIAGVFVTIGCIACVAAIIMVHLFTTTPEKTPDFSHPLGYVAVVSSIFLFGSYGIFIKTPRVKELNVDPGVFQIYYSTGTAATLMCVVFYNNEVYFSSGELIWGIVGASMWVISQLLGFIAINSVGYAVGPAVWAGLTIVTSFVWGSTLLEEKLKSAGGSAGGIVLLVLGIVMVAVCNSPLPDKLFLTEEAREARRSLLEQSISASPFSVNAENSSGPVTERYNRLRYAVGMACAIVLGLINGSLQVPFSCYSKDVGKDEAAITYMVNFSAGVAISTPVLCLVWWLARFQKIPPFHFVDIVLPGLVTGVYWACGYFAATYATQYLGNTVGYPLTQTCILVNGLWGIGFYKEIHGKHKILLFVTASFVIIGGATMLALFGASSGSSNHGANFTVAAFGSSSGQSSDFKCAF